VISRHTVNSFGNYDKPIPEIAQEINVDYLVEASVLNFADSITLQLRLIQALPEESIVLAQSFTGDISNIFRLYTNIATQIAQKIDLDLSQEDKEKLPSPRTVNPESYKAYLRGIHHLNMDTPEDKEKGLEFLHEAVRIDPGDPFANAALALGYIEIVHGPLGTADDFIKAEAAANQALKLDTTLAEVYAAMAEVYLYKLWEFDKAERNFIKALELNPNLAFTHWHYGWALYLWGRMEEGIVENELAQKYDPFNPNFTAHLGLLYCYDGRHEDALREAQKSLEIEKDYQMGYYALGEVYLAMGRIDDAIKAHKKLVELYPWWKWALGNTYAISGHRDEAEKILNELGKSEVSPFNALGLTIMYGALGRMDEAFKWLAHEPHAAWVPWIAVIPSWSKPLRDDPRFEDFLERLNLPK
jgi:tetratricopeptide (TPR) repeat protein